MKRTVIQPVSVRWSRDDMQIAYYNGVKYCEAEVWPYSPAWQYFLEHSFLKNIRIIFRKGLWTKAIYLAKEVTE